MIKKTEKGFAMVLALVLLLAMSLMGGALILIASGDHQSNNDSDQYQQTFYAAEMGLLEGERYILNQKNGPYNDAGVKQTALANLPQNLSPVPAWDGTMTKRNYTTDSVTGTNCYNSFKDIDRLEFKRVVAESWNFGNILSDSGIGSSKELERLKKFYYEFFITKIGDATFMGQGSSITLGAGGSGKNGVAYRVYGCGIYDGSEQMIVSLESVIVLPK